ncbi:PIN domain-containing protein [Haloquadratum walsbyi]|jgi:predicted nucleic acid-binding protein|uniref:Ribonuclease VapC n=1 Tax=Haloquadratum walsbyi (strain DSM 16790 / HBSQ001) TaxID=362976 RepID=Q18EF3_HALWD|nr:PIN domain-containing protein [Haloquadratum walsbyi]CAJ53676.1 probable ribonuclease VapC [Haloquadratum walsbyi DSM 16790]
MSDEYVFDTEAIIAYLYKEPGHEVVADLLDQVFSGETDGVLTETNASEVFYLVARFEGVDDAPTDASLREADRDIRALERQGLELEAADWRLAAEVKADGSISLADAYAVALAHERDATLVAGADDDFDELPIEVDLDRFRNHGV